MKASKFQYRTLSGYDDDDDGDDNDDDDDDHHHHHHHYNTMTFMLFSSVLTQSFFHIMVQ